MNILNILQIQVIGGIEPKRIAIGLNGKDEIAHRAKISNSPLRKDLKVPLPLRVW